MWANRSGVTARRLPSSAQLQSIYGDASMSSLMILGSVPLYNIMAVVILMLGSAHCAGSDRNMAEKLKECGKGILI